MAATSGVNLSGDLTDLFNSAMANADIRFIKVSIQNELMSVDGTVKKKNQFTQDLEELQTLLDDTTPCYVLGKLDSEKPEWMLVAYVPDSAKVRDKMIYASSRAILNRALGDYRPTETIFAKSKADVTPAAYAAHKKGNSAPPPMSAREVELAGIRDAEKERTEGMASRKSHVGATAHGLNWSPEVEKAVADLFSGSLETLIVLGIDTATETLILSGVHEVGIQAIPATLPANDPSYAFFPIGSTSETRHIGFIYSCPSSSPVRHRMIYASGVGLLVNKAKELTGVKAVKRFETSEPGELDLSTANDAPEVTAPPVSKAFAKPRGPGRR